MKLFYVAYGFWYVNNLERLYGRLTRITSDSGLMPFHICLYIALCQVWMTTDCSNSFNISRKKIMKLSKIRSKATYHKIIDDLQIKGYIKYKPSFHPEKGSTVSFS